MKQSTLKLQQNPQQVDRLQKIPSKSFYTCVHPHNATNSVNHDSLWT